MTATTPAPSSADYVAPVQRIALDAAPDNYRAIRALAEGIALDPGLRVLVDIRVSQLNGCAFCLDKHLAHARERGEAGQRLDTLAGWCESPFFTAAERAALALAEAATRLADVGHVPDAVYDEAERRLGREQVAELMYAIAVINALNRLVVISQTPPPAR